MFSLKQQMGCGWTENAPFVQRCLSVAEWFVCDICFDTVVDIIPVQNIYNKPFSWKHISAERFFLSDIDIDVVDN